MPLRIPNGLYALPVCTNDPTEIGLLQYAKWLATEIALVRTALAEIRAEKPPVTTAEKSDDAP